ncbi:MAG TPA: hypothetical protein C5S37_08305 [Methanophagales archaeon]|nr:hypothetical protein [Methanophagales archaeon]
MVKINNVNFIWYEKERYNSGIRMSETKNVQMNVDEVTHNLLKSISQRKKMSLEDIVKDAIAEYIRKYKKGVEVEKDAIFELIGSFETKEGDWSERDDWRV